MPRVVWPWEAAWSALGLRTGVLGLRMGVPSTEEAANTVYRPLDTVGAFLNPAFIKLLKRFAHLANKSALHPLDWRRFYEFVRDCRSRAPYSEEEMARLLIKEGFSETYATYIGEIYVHLRNFKRLI